LSQLSGTLRRAVRSGPVEPTAVPTPAEQRGGQAPHEHERQVVHATINERGRWQFTRPDGSRTRWMRYQEAKGWWEDAVDDGFEIEVIYE
jgi:hypothetical protein